MVAGFCCDTAVCGDGVLNLLSEGHWRGSRKRFNQSINQPLWSSSLCSSSSPSSSSASSSVVSWAQVSEPLFQYEYQLRNHTHRGCTVMFIANHGRGHCIGNVGLQKTEGGDNSETERPAGMMLIVMMSHRRHHHHRP